MARSSLSLPIRSGQTFPSAPNILRNPYEAFLNTQERHDKRIRKQEEVWSTAPPLTSCMTLSNLINLSGPRFLHPSNGNDNIMPNTEVAVRIKEANICNALRIAASTL